MDKRQWSVIVRSRFDYKCAVCGRTDGLQSHDPTRKHTDPKDGICLCAEHHADEHPEVPRQFILTKTNQKGWENTSIYALSQKGKICTRTVTRRAKRFGLDEKHNLSKQDVKALLSGVLRGAGIVCSMVACVSYNCGNFGSCRTCYRRKEWMGLTT